MKRLVVCLAVLLLVVAAAPMLTASALQGYTDGFGYEIKADDTVAIVSYDGDESEIVIPDTIDGMPVTEIAEEAFICNETITSIKMPESVIRIGGGAFDGCTKLADISMPGVTSIGFDAFMNTAAFYDKDNLVDGKVVYINDCLVFVYPEIEKHDIREGTRVIADYAFHTLYEFKEVTIPDTVEYIGNNSFRATGLKKVTIPGSVKHVGGFAFEYCEQLEEVTISSGTQLVDGNVFANCPKLTTVNIPESVLEIGDNAFKQSGTADVLTFLGPKGSYAETFASQNGFLFKPVGVASGSSGNDTDNKDVSDAGNSVIEETVSEATTPGENSENDSSDNNDQETEEGIPVYIIIIGVVIALIMITVIVLILIKKPKT